MTLDPVMTAVEAAFLEAEFPQMQAGGRAVEIGAVGPGCATLRFTLAERHLRPGGTVSGPARILKLGKSLVVLDVAVTALGSEDTITHAVATYSIPPKVASTHMERGR